MSEPLLTVEGLGFAYPGQPPLLQGWSASIGPGVTELHGDTGSGKSTLVRVLAGVLPPTAGHLILEGAALAADPQAYRRQVFHVDTTTDRFDQVKGGDCLVALGDGEPDAVRRDALVQGFGLAPHIDKPLYMLSTGSKRKVWLVAALLSRRALTLLDEPAAALDSASTQCLWQALAEIAARHDRAVVVASSERIRGLALAASIVLPP